MIKDYTKFEQDGIKIEVNWNKKVTPCKEIKVTMGDKVGIIPRQDFYAMMFIFGDSEQQAQLVPASELVVHEVRCKLSVIAKKNIKKGETINLTHKYMTAIPPPGRIKIDSVNKKEKVVL